MKSKERKRNTPIATLIKNYINKKSGKVPESRKEIQRRFDHLDWKDQKKIMQAFLESGKGDRLWAYSKLVDNWDKSFEPRIKELWEQSHEGKSSWVVIRYFRLAKDKSYIIDRSKLSITDYLSVLYHTDRPLSDYEARDLLYKTVHDVCTEDVEETQLSLYPYIGEDDIISPINFQNVNLAIYYLRKMGLIAVVRQFETWNEEVQRAVSCSSEYKAVLTMDLSEYVKHEATAKIAKKYGYLALDYKYKTEAFCIDNILTPREWFKENTISEDPILPIESKAKNAELPFEPEAKDTILPF